MSKNKFPIFWQEHGIHAIIMQIEPTGERLLNMRDGKPYFGNGKLFINIDGVVNEILEAEFKDDADNIIKQDDLNLDTDVRIAAIIINDGKVLLFHRIKQSKEYYVFPGGHRRVKETDLETLIREVDEETGLTIRADQAELFMELKKEGFGIEKYFLVKGDIDFANLKAVNPDEQPGEGNTSTWMNIKEAAAKDNVFPKEVINKLTSL